VKKQRPRGCRGGVGRKAKRKPEAAVVAAAVVIAEYTVGGDSKVV